MVTVMFIPYSCLSHILYEMKIIIPHIFDREHLSKLLKNFLTSGKLSENNEKGFSDVTIRYMMMNAACIMGIITLIFSIILSIQNNSYLDAIICAITVAALFFVVLYARTDVEQVFPAVFAVVSIGILCALLIWNGDARGTGFIICCIFPFLAIFMLGTGIGLVSCIILFLILCALFFVPGVSRFPYGLSLCLRLYSVYALAAGLAFLVEKNRIEKYQTILKLAGDVTRLTNESTAIREILSEGIFFMDEHCIIQPSYSRALEDILVETDLEGLKFLDLLSSSLSSKELAHLEDYFDMLINGVFDKETLEEINPLNEVAYISNTVKEKKTLFFSFSVLERENGRKYILVSVLDVSIEQELYQLTEDVNSQVNQDLSILEIIHANPEVLADFSNNIDFEFSRIDRIISGSETPSQNILISLRQSIYAIMVNALVIGLDKLSGKLYGLENSIKNLSGDDAFFDNIDSIIEELRGMGQKKNLLHERAQEAQAIKKVQAAGEKRSVFLDILAAAAERSALEFGKKVRFEAASFDEHLMSEETRRFMEGILLQLVINAVVHGIENKDERAAAGKDEIGLVSLAMKKEDGKIHISLSDDGSGLDYRRISQKADQLDLAPEVLSSKPELVKLLFTFGFSTTESGEMYSGQGIGLHLVKGRLKELKGVLRLHSEEGKGTTFNIYIPDAALY